MKEHGKKMAMRAGRTLLRLGMLLSGLWLAAAAQAQFTYTTNADHTLTVSVYTGEGGAVVIPDSVGGMPVVGIGDGAFSGNSSLTCITIPYTVTHLGSYAFQNCRSLTGVFFQGNAPTPDDDTRVFAGTTNATTYYRSISTGWGATFDGLATAQTEFPFQFTYGTNGGAGTIYVAGCAATPSYSLIGTVVIPSYVNGVPVVGIGDNVFPYLGLTGVIIPEGITSIGYAAFQNCGLTSVTLPSSVTQLGNNVFAGCQNLASVTFAVPSHITGIGLMAFRDCGLTNITLPSGVTSIGQSAFYGCTSLIRATIPSSVSSIGDSAFLYCTRLTGVFFQGNAPHLNIFPNSSVFGPGHPIMYYLLGANGWGATLDGYPTVALLPSLQPSVIQSNNVPLSWTALAGKTYHVEYRADLTAGDWEPVSTLSATQTDMSITLPVTSQQGFYRIGIEP